MKPIQLVQLTKGFVLLLVSTIFVGCVSAPLQPKQAADASRFNAQLGANYLRQGELEQARDKLEKALEQDERNAFAHVAYGQLQQRIDNPKKAHKHFKRAISLQPDEAEHRNIYGVFLCQNGDVEQAEAEFNTAAANPFYKTPQYALDNAGVCMLDSDRLDVAERYLRKALETDPQFPNAYLHMAELLYKKERLTVADAYFQRYMSKGTDTAESLYLGMRIKRDAGETSVAEKYAGRLLNEFPTSDEAGQYLARSAQ